MADRVRRRSASACPRARCHGGARGGNPRTPGGFRGPASSSCGMGRGDGCSRLRRVRPGDLPSKWLVRTHTHTRLEGPFKMRGFIGYTCSPLPKIHAWTSSAEIFASLPMQLFLKIKKKSAGSGAPVSWPEKILTLQDGLLARRIRFLLGCEWLCCGNTSLPLSLYPSCSQLGRGCEIFKFQGQLFKADRGAAEACGTNY